MAVPQKRDIYRPVLELAAASGESLNRKQVADRVIDRLALTESDLQEMVPSNMQTRVDNRMQWAITDLKLAGLLLYPEPRHIQITPQGREYLANHPGVITESEVARLRQKPDGGSNPVEPIVSDTDTLTPDEQIARSHQQHQEMLSDQILDSMKSLEPAGFERLVVGLLSNMGYGDGRVTGRSGDQGIDGILDEDTLGLEKVCIQAKRYDTAQVGEPEIRNFAGSLDRQGAAKGVFITTSTFSPTARQAARDISMSSKSVRLVDGQELAALMIRHGVGVVTEITYEVKKLDANYFAEV